MKTLLLFNQGKAETKTMSKNPNQREEMSRAFSRNSNIFSQVPRSQNVFSEQQLIVWFVVSMCGVSVVCVCVLKSVGNYLGKLFAGGATEKLIT